MPVGWLEDHHRTSWGLWCPWIWKGYLYENRLGLEVGFFEVFECCVCLCAWRSGVCLMLIFLYCFCACEMRIPKAPCWMVTADRRWAVPFPLFPLSLELSLRGSLLREEAIERSCSYKYEPCAWWPLYTTGGRSVTCAFLDKWDCFRRGLDEVGVGLDGLRVWGRRVLGEFEDASGAGLWGFEHWGS